ncbi:glycosyltransferase family 4 protein [Lacticaseibacillus paracasei]|uniref:glycosyltransferase family 4 protein n=1 Tax=Lacticaseibacillus paracasei TaxID=1597 RepID=UPI0025A2B594|nr:glycosyltransferase family 4 protein [Lacticaseibacillus paracasei]MDM7527914.1 glycosyltransferase family 4 protein [Lacticaseibacillus paracasei]
MKILVITQQYPRKNDLYRNMFVHTRLNAYRHSGENLHFQVFVLNGHSEHYSFEGINVICGGNDDLRCEIKESKYQKIVVHFLTYGMVGPLLREAQLIPKIIWVHGYEALSWKRRIFNATSPLFLRYVLANEIQLFSFRKFVRRAKNAHFVFVSNWMKNVAEVDTTSQFKCYSIIPNGIDTEVYSYKRKDASKRFRVLMIRPFNSRKYATDVAVRAIEKLSKSSYFSKFSFTIVGEGKYHSKDIRKVSHYKNVSIINRFIGKREICKLHNQNGVFLCPTRQDAQGVSMCEAMSSGLVPISSKNTAIPEFIENGVDGFLTNDTDEIVEAMIKIADSPELFQEISQSASERIRSTCSLEITTRRELSLIMK